MISIRIGDSMLHVYETPSGTKIDCQLYGGMSSEFLMSLVHVSIKCEPESAPADRDLAVQAALFLEQLADSAQAIARATRERFT